MRWLCQLERILQAWLRFPPNKSKEKSLCSTRSISDSYLLWTNQNDEWSVENLKDKHPRVPAATLLVRIQPHSETAVPALPYEAKKYDSTRCRPSRFERLLYKNRADNDDIITLKDRAPDARRKKHKDDKWKPEKTSDEELIKWCEARVKGSPKDMLHPQGIAKYSPSSGFEIKIDGMHNVKFPKKGMFGSGSSLVKVIYCLSPPASWQRESDDLNDVEFTVAHDWKSPCIHPRFEDVWKAFSGTEKASLASNSCIFFQVKTVGFSQGKKGKDDTVEVNDLAWGVLPLFSDGYFLTSYTQVPLYQGKMPGAIVSDMQDPTVKWSNVLEKAGKNSKVEGVLKAPRWIINSGPDARCSSDRLISNSYERQARRPPFPFEKKHDVLREESQRREKALLTICPQRQERIGL